VVHLALSSNLAWVEKYSGGAVIKSFTMANEREVEFG
jgi:hypothetical protein